ncbi:hypothetical protein SAMN05192574_104662 [Mucilaginibacter gossypiicola]|uniref:Uncharacterized protein n=1 Tax=Mucilaginibacter gossypiicola TaxID=551995 RepID=A0A1H8KKY7_9SPHI|nr:hypothetical protein [Mucilaginibacter gossypiicola]SEN93592.1 hypothetical protein SAMN05192574_104662 [Mucilaginibacter gossypiicola]
MKKLFILCCVTTTILVLFIPRVTKYNKFHNAEIDGKLDTVYRKMGYVVVSVNGEEYHFIPRNSHTKINFDDVAKIGDAISKKAGCDDFNLIHEGDEDFSYTVSRYW